MKTTNLPVKFDIWDTYYTINDYNDHIVISLPRRKYENDNSWGLSFYKETVTDEKIMEMVRKLADDQKIALFAKNSLAHFPIEEVIFGVPLSFGYSIDDFE